MCKATNKCVSKENKLTRKKKDSNNLLLQKLKNTPYSPYDPKMVLEDLKTVLEDKESKELTKSSPKHRDYVSRLDVAFKMLGLDNHYPAADTVDKELKPMLIKMVDDLIEEYNCTTVIEVSLAELVASAYCRYLLYTKEFSKCIDQDYLTDLKTKHFELVSKEADKAHRQYVSALTTLKQLKMPAISVNVKASTSFVAKNQQINLRDK